LSWCQPFSSTQRKSLTAKDAKNAKESFAAKDAKDAKEILRKATSTASDDWRLASDDCYSINAEDAEDAEDTEGNHSKSSLTGRQWKGETLQYVSGAWVILPLLWGYV
jgi:hypothetical protein